MAEKQRLNWSGSVYRRQDGRWVATISTGDGKRVMRDASSEAEAYRRLDELRALYPPTPFAATPGRRPNHSGTVYHRKDGRWVASVMIDKKRLTRYARTEAAAWEELAKLTAAQAQEPDSRRGQARAVPTLREWLVRWLELKKLTLRLISYHRYRSALALVLPTRAAEERLDQLTPRVLAEALAAITQARPQAGLRYIYTVLHHALAEAVDPYDPIPTNPMARVPKPKAARVTRVEWDVAQARRFLDYVAAPEQSPRCRYCAAFTVALLTGLRWSEINGLRWEDIHLADQPGQSRLWVRRATYWVEGERRWVTERPRSAEGQRVIYLADEAAAALRRLAAPLAEGRHLPLSGPVFRTSGGAPIPPSTANSALTRLCRRLELPAISPHGLRRAAATLVAAATGSAHAVQRLLGHGDVGTTARYYSYAPDPKATAAAIGKLLQEGQG